MVASGLTTDERLFSDLAIKLRDFIESGKFEKAKALLKKNPLIIDRKTDDSIEATPLIFALIRLGKEKNSHARQLKPISQLDSSCPICLKQKQVKKQQNCTSTELRQFILSTLLPMQPNLLLQDNKGNTALHRAAWYEEESICLEMINVAAKKNTLDKLISCRNRNSETPLDNMRARFYAGNPTLHPKDAKEASESFKKIHVAVTQHKTAAIDYLNRIQKQNAIIKILNQHLHGEKYKGETVLMSMFMQYYEDKNSMLAYDPLNGFLDFLCKNKASLQLAESDYSGDTLLHNVIGFKKLSIAETVFDIAAENKQLTDVLAARNIKGLDRDGNGGQVPHMALAAIGSDCVKDFFENIAAAKPLIASYVMSNEEFKQSLLAEAGRSKEDEEKTTDADVTLQILDKLIQDKLSESESESKSKDMSTLYHARSACKNLVGWHRLAIKMNEKLAENAPQKAEFNHLCTVYGKQIEGYNANSFLKACPLYEFGRVKRMYLAFSVNHPAKRAQINKLVDYLNKIQTCADKTNLDGYITVFTEAQKELESTFKEGNDLINGAAIELLKTSSQSVIAQYKAYQAGQLSTLTEAKEALKSAEKEAVTMCEQLENFREAIKCLQVRPSKISNAFGSFLDVLDQDKRTDNSTKAIICDHFEGIANRFMTEELVKLGDITDLEKNLRLKLMGQPPASPKVKAAIGILFGILAGAVIALSGGIAAVPVALIGGATTGGTLGFFHGWKKSTEYKEGYSRKVEPLRLAMDNLSKVTT